MIATWSKRLLGLTAIVVSAACSSENLTEPTVAPSFDVTGEQVSVVYVCKAGLDAETLGQPFHFGTTATGGTVVQPSLTLVAYRPEDIVFANLSTHCHVVWQGPGPSTELVTLTELVPDGYEIESARIWDIFGIYDNTGWYDVYPVDGSVTVEAGHGQVVLFKNRKLPPHGEGCTPGYWRQEHHYDSWVGYAPSDLFSDVFGVGPAISLGDAAWLGGGGAEALMRHAVAALLSASSPEVDYPLTEAEVIAMVQDAFASGEYEDTKDIFDEYNNLGCTLD